MIFLFDNTLQLRHIVERNNCLHATRTENLKGPDRFYAEIKQIGVDLAGIHYVAHRDTVNTDTYHMYRLIDTSWEGSSSSFILDGLELAYSELATHGYIKDMRPSARAVGNVARDILEGSPWQITTVSSAKLYTGSFYYVTRLEALLTLLDGANLEMQSYITLTGGRVTGRHIVLKDRLGQDRGRRYVHGDSLLTVTRRKSDADIYTAVLGRGKGEETEGGGFGRRITFEDIAWSKASGDPVDKPLGQEYVELPEATRLWGHADGTPRLAIVDFDDEADKNALLRASYEHLLQVAHPQETFNASVRDEGLTGIGDTVAIIRRDLDISYKTRIFSREVNLLVPKRVQISLGDASTSYTVSKIKELAKKLTSVELNIQTEVSAKIQALEDAMTKRFWGEDGYNYDLKVGNEYGLPAGVYSFDKPIDQNPTKFVYLGAGKIIISNEKNPDGTWNLKTLMDGDGLATNTVGAKQLIVEEINADLLRLSSGQTIKEAIDSIEVNPGFTWNEWRATRPQSLDNGQHVPFGGTLALDEDAVKVTPASESTNFGIQSPTFSAIEGERYTLSFDLKFSAPIQKLDYTYFMSPTKGDTNSTQYVPNLAYIEGSDTGYKRYTLHVTAPYTTDDARILIGYMTDTNGGTAQPFWAKDFKLERGHVADAVWAPSYDDRETELQEMRDEYLERLDRHDSELLALAQDETITPVERLDLANLHTRVLNDTHALKAKIDPSSTAYTTLVSAEKDLLDFLSTIIDAEGYSAIDFELYKTLYANWGMAKVDAETEAENVIRERETVMEAGLQTLSTRIGKYEEQITLGDGRIGINVTSADGTLEPAMSLTKDRLSFYTNGEEAAYFANGRLMIENAIILQRLEMGNHAIEKHRTDYTVFRWIGG